MNTLTTTTKKTGLPAARNERLPATAPAGTPNAEITSDRIRARAYEIYQVHGNVGAGDAASDWLQAERELNGSVPDPSASNDVEIMARVRGERLLAGGK